MENLKTELTPKEILDEKFTKNVKGYSPEEVDAFLDRVIHDYQVFLSKEKEDADLVISLRKQIQDLMEGKATYLANQDALYAEKKRLELDNASLHNKLDGIKPGDNPNVENLQYIQRINQLEEFVYSLGYDPRTLRKRNS